jgi:hypothetical protein
MGHYVALHLGLFPDPKVGRCHDSPIRLTVRTGVGGMFKATELALTAARTEGERDRAQRIAKTRYGC